jgi:hypothetical protein
MSINGTAEVIPLTLVVDVAEEGATTRGLVCVSWHDLTY